MKPSLAKGTRDFLPEQSRKRNYIFETIKKVFVKYAFQPLETPAMEQLDTLTGKYGEEGDKLLFKILNSGDYLKDAPEEFLTQKNSSKLISKISEKGLRYDLTVPFARVVAMNQHLLTFPFKRYQIQPVWRADRPQRGRYREFYQCDADVVGSSSLLYEAELIKIYDEVFHTLNIPVDIVVNHRAVLEGLAINADCGDRFMEMTIVLDKLDKIGEDAVKAELSNLNITSKNADWILEKIKDGNIDSFLFNEKATSGANTLKHIQNILSHTSLKNKLVFDPSLARGLSYYTGCILEVKPNTVKMGSLGGGGRYDNLTGVFGLQGVSGVGISFGADRIYDVMNELNLFPDNLNQATQALFMPLDEESLIHAFGLAQQLREQNISVDIYPEMAKLKKQFKYAEDLKIPFTIIVGESERQNEKYVVKDQSTGNQENLSIEEIKDKLRSY